MNIARRTFLTLSATLIGFAAANVSASAADYTLRLHTLVKSPSRSSIPASSARIRP
ncbi:MAG: hypothetical protein QNJ43_22105 [Breoghania sp.]|nr:hypothetical protein [Breoghania sp.]